MTAVSNEPSAAGSETWFSTDELAAIKGDLEAGSNRLRRKFQLDGRTDDFTRAPSSQEALHDNADVTSQHSERLEDSVQVENAFAILILIQTERVLDRLHRGLYGVCENCGQPIGRLRLEAFPRASLCMACVG